MEVEQRTSTPEYFKGCYSIFYKTHREDSPTEAREYLIGKLISVFQEKVAKNQSSLPLKILHIGSGRQVLELELINKFPDLVKNGCISIVTLDIATLSKNQLLASPSAEHVTADGSYLPFQNGSFDVVYSCMAIDFMPRVALTEALRVCKKEGDILINFHHPNLIEPGYTLHVTT